MDAKPLPPPARDDRLPPLPPSHYDNSATGWDVSPPPPPKHSLDREYETSQYNTRGHNLPDIHSSALSPHDGFDVPPITPISPVGSTPSSPSGDAKSKKKVNPLTDLIETEKVYVDLLTGIIRKVAAAWSRSNLPPPELDTMFRSVESVYKANRSLLSKLKEIGANPSSPKALGDLLMRWIDDLEAPYTKYATNYCAGFDEWDPVQSNTRLRTTLAIFSSSNPPPLPSSSPEHPPEPPLWTLDDLFLLPKGRLGYYRKLYSRLLKSTVPGRSDHRLLSGALDKLDNLLVTLDERAIIKVGANTQAPQDTEDEVVFDMRTRQSTVPLNSQTQRESDSTHGSGSIANDDRLSQETPPTSVERTSTATMSIPITDLERRLSTEQTLDIFTMQPKQVRLQIAPPTLHYTRDLRICADVVMTFTPRSTGVDVTHERGRIFVLTDLLLMCERMTPQEAARFTPDGPDMWLLYPPLAGKHLRVVPVDGSDNAFTVTILRKEIVTMYAESRQLRDRIVAEFRECIDAAATLVPAKNQAPPPPVPKLPSGGGGLPISPTALRGPSDMFSEHPNMSSISPNHPSSPSNSLPRMQSPPVNGFANMNISEDPHARDMSRMPSVSNAMSGSAYPPRSASMASPDGPVPYHSPIENMSGQGFGPGQMMRQGSFGPGQVMPSMNPGQTMPHQQFVPGQIMPPPRGASYGAGGPDPSVAGPRRSGSTYSENLPSSPYGPPGSMRGMSPYAPSMSRPSSDGSGGPALRKSTSSRSLASQYDSRHSNGPLPPMPAYPDGLIPPSRPFLPRSDSSSSLSSLPSLYAPQARPLLPSAQYSVRSMSTGPSFIDPSPPSSPVEETPKPTGPVTSRVSEQMKCKVFLQEHHAKWKSLGSAKLKLYHESPTNVKQLVVQADSKQNVLISTIVLEDGVERVGKTGVAIELSDKGQRMGVVYMLQLRDERSAGSLFESLLAGSDRSEVRN